VLGPIFAREFRTVPRTDQHYTARVAAFGGLWVLGITAWLATNALDANQTLGTSARFGRLVFQVYSFVALVLVVFFAALSAAGAVAREKDRRTFILLLLTDLRDAEIVLGKMLGALLPILLLLLGLLPILALLTLLGGMQPSQTIEAWFVLVASAFAAGSLGACVALWRDRTYQSLAFAVLGVVLYLCVTRLGIALGRWVAPAWDWDGVLAAVDPVAALAAVIQPDPTRLRWWPPAASYVLIMLAVAALLNVIGVWRLRVWNPGREPIMQRESKDDAEEDDKARAHAHAAPGRPRTVWPNPVLWREIRTRAYGRRPILIKLLYFAVIAMMIYGAFASTAGPRQPFQAAYGLLPVAILSFLLVAAQSVTAVTAERDTGALDLLLVTDLSPNEFIFGKLLGVAYNVKEFILPPLLLAGAYAWIGWLATPPPSAQALVGPMNAESLAAVSGGLVVLFAFVLILGLFIALRQANSRQAILNTLGTVFFLSIGTIVCIYLILINGGTFEFQFLSFSLFLIAGIGGLLAVLNAGLPSGALKLASVALPLAAFYAITNVLVAKPGSPESTPPLVPFLVIVVAFGFTISAMLVPLLSEFDVALGRTRAEE